MKTIRQQIIDLLTEENLTAKDLSKLVGIREKEVYEHLPHIERSMAAKSRKLVILPIRCLNCGYVFEGRKRYTRPGRCPRCRQTRVQIPKFVIREK